MTAAEQVDYSEEKKTHLTSDKPQCQQKERVLKVSAALFASAFCIFTLSSFSEVLPNPHMLKQT